VKENVAARAQAVFQQGAALHSQSKLDEAQLHYDRALKLQPTHFGALYLSGVIALRQNLPERAVEWIGRAIRVNPQIPDAHHDHGRAQFQLRRYAAAVVSYDQAIALNPNYAEAHYNRGTALNELEHYEAAIASYDQAIALKCEHAAGYYNRGNALYRLKRVDAALASYDKAIALRPDYPEAYNNRGMVLQELRQHEAALVSYDEAIAIMPEYPGAHYNRANALDELKQYEAAIASYDRAIALQPDLKFIAGTRLLAKMKIGDWGTFEAELAELTARLERNEAASPPLAVLALTGCASMQKRAAEIWMQEKCALNLALPAIPKRTQHGKIRIGYFSADFRNHAVSLLSAGLFEEHDRSRFSVFAFSFGPDTEDEMRQRTQRAFDDFLDVRTVSDRDIVLLARKMELDIAVDLGGLTEDSRPLIFAARAAPLQVNFLGYPGTMGAACIDYLIGDLNLIPEGSRRHYSEKIIYLPNSYQVNDAKRVTADKILARDEFGLPRQGFVFCCFNNGHKITPDTFAGWMRIMRQVDGSVLWLLEDNPWAVRNLRREAVQRGVDAERLVFAKRVELSEHLARQRLADLFLDTLPYNAHTTASDALWVGLPVLTRTGETFAGRVAASLLNAIELPELITATRDEYEQVAVALASDPQRLTEIKQRLAGNRLTTALFDTRLFTKNIETAYTEIYERYRAGLPADHIHVR
jgi:protein O-GlcNAc transferase